MAVGSRRLPTLGTYTTQNFKYVALISKLYYDGILDGRK
jgi:hypothetical protein